jgi:hypothetical protein
MDVVRDLTGEEARLLAIQFLGQNLGEMKDLDKQIVSSLKPLASNINPTAMVQSIPLSQQPQQPAPPAPIVPNNSMLPTIVPHQHTPAATTAIIPSIASLTNTAQATIPLTQADPNQLELNFNASPYSEQIFNKLDSLESKLIKFAETQQLIVDAINDLKKKTDEITTTVLT